MKKDAERTPEEIENTAYSRDLMTGKVTFHWDNQRNPDLSKRDRAMFILWGVIALILGLATYRSMMPRPGPIDTLALITRGQATPGTVVHTEEVEVEDDRGNVGYSDVGTYRYQVSGIDFTIMEQRASGKLPQQTLVEYLPDNPKVCRIKGRGAQTLWGFVIHDVLLGALIFVVCILPSLWMFREGINVHDWRVWWKDRLGKQLAR